jgi:hypothetical protein
LTTEQNKKITYTTDWSTIQNGLVNDDKQWNLSTSDPVRLAWEEVEATTVNVTFDAGTLPKNMTEVTFDKTSQEVDVGGAFTPAAPSYEGSWVYEFAGWTDGTTKYSAGTAIDVEHDMTLTPVWKLHSLNGDDKWNIDDVLTLLSCVSRPTVYKLTDEQRDCIGLGENEVPTMSDVKELMQKISGGNLENKN